MINEAYEKLGLFYLGKELDLKNFQPTDDLLLLKNKNLTTHAAIIGMTGSGKTGLGISLIEEATLDNIPSIIIDPKGDMGNLLLAFDDFDPKKYEEWIDESEARKKGLDISSYAKKIASTWKEGIKSWNQDENRVKRFKDSANFNIYTPGSSSGISLSVLDSFEAPSSEILEDLDTYSHLLNSTVTSILALIGLDSDFNSKEYLLLSTIFNYYWKKNQSLNLEELIGNITNPPFSKVGVLTLKSFYPQSERLKLAMKLNNILASPTFASWIEGEALEIENLLYKDTKPCVSILSIAHLNESQRMFFVTLFLNKFIAWMRRQSGSSNLKVLLYMDEIYGFFPATSNPPSKNPMLLLLKQARAYGVGITLATQNPIDLDYKGLSNIGTWFIGRLQTKQDINRVIDGLITNKNSLDKKKIQSIISNLKSRQFLLKSAHRDKLALFNTRWVLSYLKGPLSKVEISKLMKDKKIKPNVKEPYLIKKEHKNTPSTKPIISESIKEYYYNKTLSKNIMYEPYMICDATIRYFNIKRAIDKIEKISFKYYLDDSMDSINWSEFEINEDERDFYETKPKPSCSFYSLPNFILQAKNTKEFERDFQKFLYREKKLKLYRCKRLKLESNVDESLQNFQIRVIDILKEKKENSIEKLKERFAKKRDLLELKLQKALNKLEKEELDVSEKKTDTLLSFGMTLLDAFLGKKAIKRSTTSRAGATIRSAGRIFKEKEDVKFAQQKVELLKEELEELESNLKEKIDELSSEFDINNYPIDEFFITPKKSDIDILNVSILWQEEQ